MSVDDWRPPSRSSHENPAQEVVRDRDRLVAVSDFAEGRRRRRAVSAVVALCVALVALVVPSAASSAEEGTPQASTSAATALDPELVARLEAALDDGFAASKLPGVTVGADTVVGAGSVVTTDLPAGVVAVGNPARVVRDLAR